MTLWLIKCMDLAWSPIRPHSDCLFTLVDAWFLGVYVGAEALTAVTLMFPLFMMLIAMATIVSNGFSSVMARLLGAGAKSSVLGNAFAGAILLSLIFSGILIAGFLSVGFNLVELVAKGSDTLVAVRGQGGLHDCRIPVDHSVERPFQLCADRRNGLGGRRICLRHDRCPVDSAVCHDCLSVFRPLHVEL